MAVLKAVLSDMDGVIADTEILDHRIQVAFVHAVNDEVGASSDGLSFEGLLGSSGADLTVRLCELTGGRLAPDELERRFAVFDTTAREGTDYGALFRPQVIEILEFAREHGLKTAVVSSSSPEHIAEVLDACGIGGHFDTVMSGELVERSKPDPEVYLRAIERLGAQPGECVAIEDSAAGIAAAKAAGAVVIAYEERRVPVDQSAADYLAHDMADAAQLVRDLYAASAGIVSTGRLEARSDCR